MDRREFLYQRKNRCVGKILGELEKVIFDDISESQQKALRSIIKSQISMYHRDALDTLEMTSGTRINALAMKVKDRVGQNRNSSQT